MHHSKNIQKLFVGFSFQFANELSTDLECDKKLK